MRKFNLQFFAEPTGMEALDTLLSGMDDGAQSTSTQDTTTDNDPAPTDNDPAQPNADDSQTQQTPPPKQTQKPSQAEQMNYAFGRMRTENAQLKDMVGKIAKAVGIEYKDENELVTKLNDFSIQNIAKQQNVPAELLQRMELLERNNQLYEQEQRKQQVLLGFQALKDEHNLSDEQLTDFVHELNDAGKNPLLVNINLDEAYRTMHFNEIMEARVQRAVQEALAKSSVADTHSTTPNNKSGRSNDNIDVKVNSVSALDDLLRDVKL